MTCVLSISQGVSPEIVLGASQADHVVLVVLEGIGNESIQAGEMPVLRRLAQEGATTWTARSIVSPFSVPAMASLLTGLPVDRHRITQEWESYDFSRAFMRSPTMFDYLDLAGGLDTALFLMDERFYQLARPEIYVDSQVCGTAKPNCNPETLTHYIRDYLAKVTSEKGHGFRLFDVPGLLVVHLPAARLSGEKKGWDSKAYKKAVASIDAAVAEILKIYDELGVLEKTMIIVTGLNDNVHGNVPSGNGATPKGDAQAPLVPWLAWGANVKPHYEIQTAVSIMDTGATVMEALGLETHTEWESRAVNEIFQAVPPRRTTGNEAAYN